MTLDLGTPLWYNTNSKLGEIEIGKENGKGWMDEIGSGRMIIHLNN